MLLFAGAAASSAFAADKKILILGSEDMRVPAAVLVDKAIRERLAESGLGPVQFYVESMEDARIAQDYKAELLALLQRKHGGQNFDCIFAYGQPALRFLVEYQAVLFPNVPRIYAVLDQRDVDGLDVGRNTTGVAGKVEFVPTVELMLSQNPAAKKIVIVTGEAPLDKAFLARAQKDFVELNGNVEFQYITNSTADEVKNQLTALPKDSLVLVLPFSRDRNGSSFNYPSAISYIARTSNVPVYGIAETGLGAGIVGGDLINIELQGKLAADLAVRVLNGEAPQDIRPVTVPGTAMFDARELERWKIDESTLPAGSIVRFKVPSVFEEYRAYIAAAIAILLIQSVLIISLLVSQMRRRRAERERNDFRSLAADEHARLNDIVSNVPGIVWETRVADESGGRQLSFVSGYIEEMLGYSVQECLANPQHILSRWPEEDRDTFKRAFDSAFDRKEPFKIELKVLDASNEFRWVYVSGAPRLASDGEFLGLVGSCVDISERKAAEEVTRKAHEEVQQMRKQLHEENIYLKEVIKREHNFEEIIGHSDALKYLLFKVEQVAPTNATVLINGETGTGKELIARAIHSTSLRKSRPLVSVNCAALSPSLVESELFGHVRGAFTGAATSRIGRFELAAGATIFLDEVGELPLELQAKLLRVIEQGEFERLGSSKTIKGDVRIIAATNRNLEAEVKKGRFREDLLFRLNVFPITVPPLRDRKEDIPELTEHFTNLFAKKIGKKVRSLSPATLRRLTEHSWPGNVRELANVIERAVINTQTENLLVTDALFRPVADNRASESGETLEAVESKHISHVLEMTNWRIEGTSGAARILGLNPSTLRTRMSKLGISRTGSKKDHDVVEI